RFADAQELAQALRWSHEQSPLVAPVAPSERGAWVLEPRQAGRPSAAPVSPAPAPRASPGGSPAGNAVADELADDELSRIAMQSPVLRVAPAPPLADSLEPGDEQLVDEPEPPAFDILSLDRAPPPSLSPAPDLTAP